MSTNYGDAVSLPQTEGSSCSLAACLPLGKTSDHSKSHIDVPGDAPSCTGSSAGSIFAVIAAVVGVLASFSTAAGSSPPQLREIAKQFDITLPL